MTAQRLLSRGQNPRIEASVKPGPAHFRFAALDGLAHKYPNGRNNPAGFAAAPEFWAFFQTHRLSLTAPASGAAIRAGGRASAANFTPPIGTDKGS
jgi:hypothetical protein